jgi:hypothetical protein
MSSLLVTILLVVVVVAVIAAIVRSIRIVPQASAGIVERFGRYHRTLNAGLNMVTPFVDRLRPLIDLREQVVSFPPQPVITEDNLVVGIDTVIYFQVTDARAATYEVANYITAVEQLTVTWRSRSPRATRSTASCARNSTRRPASGGSGSAGWSSRPSSRPAPSRTRWRSRCAPTATSAPPSCPPKGPSSPPS